MQPSPEGTRWPGRGSRAPKPELRPCLTCPYLFLTYLGGQAVVKQGGKTLPLQGTGHNLWKGSPVLFTRGGVSRRSLAHGHLAQAGAHGQASRDRLGSGAEPALPSLPFPRGNRGAPAPGGPTELSQGVVGTPLPKAPRWTHKFIWCQNRDCWTE